MKINIDKIDAHELSLFIKKLLPIDKFIFMKMGQDNTISSVYFPERDAVKLVNVKTDDLITANIEKPIKVSFYNGTKVVEALNHFSGDIYGSIEYTEVDGEFMASDFVLNDGNLKIKLACADPSLSFMEMSKDEMQRAFDTESSLFEFNLLTTHVDRMKSLFTLEKDEDTFTLYTDENSVFIKGKSYDANIVESYKGEYSQNNNVVIYKKYLNLLDKENYNVTVCGNKIVFKSLDTNTHLTVAVALSEEDED